MRCCARCPCVNIPDQETYYQYSETTHSIRFHIYHLILSCTAHGRIPLNDKNICGICKQDSAREKSTNIYTRKELVITDTKFSNCHKSLYIPEIQKLEFHLPHVHILGTNNCGDSRLTTFKHRESCQDVLCHRDYTDMIVASFAHQIQSE